MTSDRTASGPGSRRRYSAELQAQVLAECEAAGASVAKVAMSHGINANVVHRWRQLAREGRGAAAKLAAEFVPMSLPVVSPPETGRDIQIELRRGATTMTITWPLSAAAGFGAWMRELLR
jgi:transposase